MWPCESSWPCALEPIVDWPRMAGDCRADGRARRLPDLVVYVRARRRRSAVLGLVAAPVSVVLQQGAGYCLADPVERGALWRLRVERAAPRRDRVRHHVCGDGAARSRVVRA